MREEFEAAAFILYQELKAANWSSKDEGDNTPEALFWKHSDGSYGVQMFNAAWWGWQAALKVERSRN